MKNTKNKFIRFIKSLVRLDAPLGDLARDIFRDINFPMQKSEQDMISYLSFKTSIGGTNDFFEELMDEYKKINI